MPFLRAGIVTRNINEADNGENPDEDTKEKPETVEDKSDEKGGHAFPNPEIPSVVQKDGDKTLPLFSSDGDGTQVGIASTGNPNKDNGTQYERYIGSIYEHYGYSVEYNGINKNSHDCGIDLICHSDRYTVLVQCKCYSSGNISVNTIYQFFGSSKHYAMKHPLEVVSSSFWTSLKLKTDSEAFIAAEELGIKIYQGYELPC